MATGPHPDGLKMTVPNLDKQRRTDPPAGEGAISGSGRGGLDQKGRRASLGAGIHSLLCEAHPFEFPAFELLRLEDRRFFGAPVLQRQSGTEPVGQQGDGDSVVQARLHGQ